MNSLAADHAAWSRPALHAQVVRTRHDGRHEAALRISGLDSARQVLRLESMLHALTGMQGLTVDLAARRVRANWDPRQVDLPRLLDACSAAGCPAQPLYADVLDNPRRREAHAALKRLLVAGLFAMQAMMFASVLYIGHFDAVDTITRDLFRWLGLLAATPVVTWAALPFYRGVIADLRQRTLSVDTPLALAVVGIYLASIVAALRGQGDIYFDSISMLVFVLLLGRYLDVRARNRSAALSEAAADAMPMLAERRRADGGLDLVAASELQIGDHVHVTEGGVLPADGTLTSPRVRVDESLLSGESRPLTRQGGDAVIAGSVVLSGPLDMQVDQLGELSTLATLGELARRNSRRSMQARHDPAAARFAARVLLLTVLTAVTWLLINPARAFDTAVAVLVVACPCAFALAAPVVTSRVLSLLSRHGVWVNRPAALHALAQTDHALFDKTGTLTAPQLECSDIRPLRGDDGAQMLHLAASLARESRHPVSRAIAAAATRADIPRATDVEVLDGAGVRGRVAQRSLRLGRGDFACDSSAGGVHADALMLADAQGPLAIFPLGEQIRSEAADSLMALRNDGMLVEIVSGDSNARVATAAKALGVERWLARQSPEQKLQHLERLQATGATVLAVGDGSNDAPLLAAADVSASVIGGTGLAQAHADLLLGDGLTGLLLARRTAQRAERILAQNRRGALIYNLCAVPFAAFGLITPWMAVLGMCLSSLCVVLNALRIREASAEVATPHPPAQPRPA